MQFYTLIDPDTKQSVSKRVEVFSESNLKQLAGSQDISIFRKFWIEAFGTSKFVPKVLLAAHD